MTRATQPIRRIPSPRHTLTTNRSTVRHMLEASPGFNGLD